uniref:Uncharacterized protein n=1 Tax=Florenciella parvula TaxID=236787 RepID=A0A7S2CUC7_9STRA|mmetsp:Transcript_5483/g.11208  ORF Transcript_5483/g.11208 Transcript_5483/m.11208 type:complete len:150 (+) Transcript_5483:59-508(+)
MAAADVPLSPLRSPDRRTAAADTAASEDDDLVDPDEGPIWQRPYYWQLVGYNPPLHRKASHIAWWFGSKVFYGMEFIGAIVADLAGMNQSKYQYVIDAMKEDERREQRKKRIESERAMLAEEERVKREQMQMDDLEGEDGEVKESLLNG